MTTPIELIINGKDNTQGAFSSAASGISRIGEIAAGILASQVFTKLAGAVTDFATSAVSEARDAALVQADLEAVLKSTGGAAGVTSKMVDDLSTSISENSKYTDEQIKSADVLMLTFKNIGKDVFPQATQAVADMSARFKQDLSASAVQLGKALDDPIQGVSALRRIGITFTDDQEKMIKKMVEAGDVAGAQGVILQEVGKQTAGAAASQATAWDKLQHKFDNVKEKIGSALLPTLDRLGYLLIDALDDPRVQAAIDSLTEWLGTTAPAILDNLLGIFDSIQGKGFGELATMFSDAVKGVNWEELSQKLIDAINSIDWISVGVNIANGLGALGGMVANVISRIDWMGLFGAIATALFTVIASIAMKIGQAWTPAIQQMGITIGLLRGIMQAKLEEIKGAIVAKIVGWVTAMQSKISQFGEIGKNIVNSIKTGFMNAWGGLVTAASGMVSGLIDTIKKLLGIASPSKVFTAIGKNITQGLAGGISDDAPMAKTAMRSVSRQLINSSTTNNNYNNRPVYFFGTLNQGNNQGLSEVFG